MNQTLASRAKAELPELRRRFPGLFAPDAKLRFRIRSILFVLFALVALAVWRLDVDSGQLVSGFGRLVHFLSLMLPPSPGGWDRFLLFAQALAETVAIAFLGTLMASILAFPLGLLAARNATVNRFVLFASRRLLDSVRGVDTLIWALIWVGVVGLGPFAGVLAVMTGDVGALGKLFADAVEAADEKPAEGVTAAGGNRIQAILFGVLPQAAPVIAAQALYFFESNTRSATIIGVVGAGGIGLHLSEQIRTLEWPTVSFLVLMILAAVIAIDALSSRLRAMMIGGARAGCDQV
jgi:phosphonate transport system permease protein